MGWRQAMWRATNLLKLLPRTKARPVLAGAQSSASGRLQIVTFRCVREVLVTGPAAPPLGR